MKYYKETKKKNEYVEITSTIKKGTDKILLDFGSWGEDEFARPTIWITDNGDDVAMFIIKNEKQIDEFIDAFSKLKKFIRAKKEIHNAKNF